MSNEENFTSFLCSSCHTEIEASLDMVGEEAECPACGAKLKVPAPQTGDGLVRHGDDDLGKSHTQAIKSRTIRIELGDL